MLSKIQIETELNKSYFSFPGSEFHNFIEFYVKQSIIPLAIGGRAVHLNCIPHPLIMLTTDHGINEYLINNIGIGKVIVARFLLFFQISTLNLMHTHGKTIIQL